MRIEKEEMGIDQTRKILVGVRFDSDSKELLGWAIVKVANPLDHVVALHVCRNPDDASKEKKLLDDYLDIFKNLCDIKKVKLSGKILTGKSIRKTLVSEAKGSSAVAVITGITKAGFIGGRVSTAKYCAKHLPLMTKIFSVHNGKVVFERLSNDDTPGVQEDPRPSFHKPEKSECGDSEVDSNGSKVNSQNSESGSTDNSEGLVENRCVGSENEVPLRTVSLNKEDMTEQKPGWPLLRRSSLPTQKALDSRKMSVVQWVLNFPDRSPPETPQSNSSSSSSSSNNGDSCSSNSESPLASTDGAFSSKSSQSLWSELLLDQEPGLPFELNFLEFTWFSYEVLRNATSTFSQENLIGKGGCSRVYKGTFLDGKEVAVKVLKSSKQAWKDFSQEVNIMSSMRHKNITPLLGVCIDNSELISVYEFMSKGSLEENLHAENKDKCLLSWDARFTVAVGIAEALVYLHQGCSRPVIHRDVKTSNILLSHNFEPQLSDFGLAIWGPNSTSFETYTDVVGTFGYLAPEYFMYGKVTDKLDVYSFGVVLLELLTGRKPINSSKGQESLVMWAKPKLQLGGKVIKGILDPSLEGSVDESQMQRMVVAATLCLTRATRLRPKMDQILKFLKGEASMETWTKSHNVYDEQEEGENCDEFYQNSSTKKSHLSLALLDVEDDYTSCSSGDGSNSPHTLEDLLNWKMQEVIQF
ncbi:protein kinase STUNTED isoform X3 [Spinacia oleracea]|uniref:Receptor-like cytosolic serine/threonine-protein kinase RBK1 isoform X1 n=1 Tax=Spinacia oleracea TaxID=3562 RepID=A0A9R0IMN6_SPIOL|nr:protein kinase STUNTED isoform X3 [Spinacia oleracea]XP_021851971.1 protein kinase STUNTED isoform X3 [Spinacia oleracea]